MNERAAGARRLFLCSRELGCPINLALTTRLHNYARRNGWSFAEAEAADDIIIVSCSSLPEARRAVAAAAEHFAGRHPEKRVVVTCCFVPDDQVRLPNVVYVPLERQSELDRLFGAAVQLREVPAGATVEDAAQLRALAGTDRVANHPYNVMVAAGCLNHCSFCIGKSVFETVRSVPLAQVIATCQDAVRGGYRNLIIGASDVAAYGRDLGGDVTQLVAALFDEVLGPAPDVVVGFKGFEPSGFIRHFPQLKQYFGSGRVTFLSLPIQSGSDRVLHSMNRRYRAEDIVALIRELRALAPQLRIETDIIFAYPTETREDFEASLAMLPYFDHVQMLGYERHHGTKAAAIDDVFDAAERARRQAVVTDLQRRERDCRRPECRPRIEIRLPSPLGEVGFGVLELPK